MNSAVLRRFAFAASVLALAGQARADDGAMKPEARAHLDKGLALYEAKDYTGAIRELAAGHAIDPKPAFLYARAQAERLSGNCEAAVVHYDEFLATGPEPEREAAARANLARCKDELAAQAPAPTPTAAPAPAPAPSSAPPPEPAPSPAPIPAPLPPAVSAERSPWYADAFGDVLLGTGVVALGVGGFFVATSYSSEAKAKEAGTAPSGETYQAHRDRITRAERQRSTGVIVGGAGLALVGGAIARYVLRDPVTTTVGAWVGPRSAGASLGRRF
jgi:tetratricopeptide (TPR) repeat protein